MSLKEKSYQKLFERFERDGVLRLPTGDMPFAALPWSKHPTFRGVELKHIVAAAQTGGQFSFHLVRLAPKAKIERHIHEKELETHEVIAGSGVCRAEGARLEYLPGTISILPLGVPHEVEAGEDGLYIFAKFIPALC